MVEQRIVDTIHKDHARIDEGIDPFGILVRPKNDIKADRGRRGIGDVETEAERGCIIRGRAEHRIDRLIDQRISRRVVADAKAGVGVRGARHRACGQNDPRIDSQGGQRAVIKPHRRAGRGVQRHRRADNLDARVLRQKRVGEGLRRSREFSDSGHACLLIYA